MTKRRLVDDWCWGVQVNAGRIDDMHASRWWADFAEWVGSVETYPSGLQWLPCFDEGHAHALWRLLLREGVPEDAAYVKRHRGGYIIVTLSEVGDRQA